MKYAKSFLFSLAVTTLLYNNCGGFTSIDRGSQNLNSANTIGPDGQYPKIPSNLKVEDWVWENESKDIANGYGHPDVIGAFRFICKPSHNLYDDPIVYPNMPGASHLHTFFGNTKADAYSTYESLRKTGDGSCSGGPLNRSAYWMPALQVDDGDGNHANDKVVMPDYTIIYYKMLPEDAQPLPRGLRFIFGYNMSDPAKSTGFDWHCDSKNGVGGIPGSFKNMKEMFDAGCPAGSTISAGLTGMHCWNGELDSPDHRSHLSHEIRDASTNWQSVCPASHPRTVPSFTLKAVWTVGQGEAGKLYLSSDYMHPQKIPGSTMHTDWFGAWDDDIMEEWMGRCVADFRSCSAGVFGNGRGMKDPYDVDKSDQYTNLLSEANPRLVAPPPMPSNHKH